MIEVDQMMQELHAYAIEEMRNRGLEDAAKLLERQAEFNWRDARTYHGLANEIRSLKRDPRLKLSDWWGLEKKPENYISDQVFGGVRLIEQERVEALRENHERTHGC